jgi:hypothetical protein
LITMGKNDIIEGSIGHWTCPTDTTDNLIMAGSGNENYTTNNTSAIAIPCPPKVRVVNLVKPLYKESNVAQVLKLSGEIL